MSLRRCPRYVVLGSCLFSCSCWSREWRHEVVNGLTSWSYLCPCPTLTYHVLALRSLVFSEWILLVISYVFFGCFFWISKEYFWMRRKTNYRFITLVSLKWMLLTLGLFLQHLYFIWRLPINNFLIFGLILNRYRFSCWAIAGSLGCQSIILLLLIVYLRIGSWISWTTSHSTNPTLSIYSSYAIS